MPPEFKPGRLLFCTVLSGHIRFQVTFAFSSNNNPLRCILKFYITFKLFYITSKHQL